MAPDSAQTIALEGGELRKLATGSLPGLDKVNLSQVSLEVAGKGLDVDYAHEMSAVAQAMNSRARQAGDAGLGLVGLDLHSGVVQLGSLASLTDTAQLLQQAEAMIQREEYAAALELVDEVLSLGPSEPEEHRARYLKAFCRAHSGDLQEALEALLPLRGAVLEGGLAARVKDLRVRIRAVLTPLVVLSFVMTPESERGAAIRQLRDAIERDPDNGMYYFVLAGSHAASGELREATAVLEEGLGCAVDDRDRLERLLEQLRQQLVAEAMAGAVRAFKARRYADAQRLAKGVPSEWQTMEVVQDFRRYADSLVRRRKPGPPPPPEGPPQRVDRLYFLLAREEIDRARQRLEAGEVGPAEEVLKSALKFVPGFPYANFLLAGCLYRSVGEWLGTPHDLDFDRQVTRLETASAAAAVAVTDPEIGTAGALAAAIGELRALVTGLRQAVESRRREAKAVNDAIEEFQSIMKSAEGGVRDAGQCTELQGRLRALQCAMPGPGDVSDAEAKAAVKALSKAVERNLDRLGAFAPRLETAGLVRACYDMFEQIMDGARHGITSLPQAVEIQGRLRQLKAQIGQASERVRDREGKRALKRLDKAVDHHLEQLGIAAEQASVGQLIQRFNALMQELGASARAGRAAEKAGEFANILSEAGALRSRVSGRESQAKLRELERAAAAVLAQLGGPGAGRRR